MTDPTPTDPTPTTDRESIQRKRAARMAAIQGTYNIAVSGSKIGLDALSTQLQEQWRDSIAHDDAEWPMDAQPEQALLNDVLQGTHTHREAIDAAIAPTLKENWKPERMSAVMMAILRCATYELLHHHERSSAMLLDEYVSLAAGFFDNPELGFIHSALQQIAAQHRS